MSEATKGCFKATLEIVDEEEGEEALERCKQSLALKRLAAMQLQWHIHPKWMVLFTLKSGGGGFPRQLTLAGVASNSERLATAAGTRANFSAVKRPELASLS